MDDTTQSDQSKLIVDVVTATLDLERQVTDLEHELMTDERFRRFIEMQRRAKESAAETWSLVQQKMVEHSIKSIRGDWGSITVAERTSFKVDDIDVLPDEYKKLAPDTKKIGNEYALTGEAPEGAEPVTTQYLLKKFK